MSDTSSVGGYNRKPTRRTHSPTPEPFRDTILYQTLKESLIFGLGIFAFISFACHAILVSKERSTPAPIVPADRQTAYETLGRSEEANPDRIGHDRFEEYYVVQAAYYDLFNDPRRCVYDHSRGIEGRWAGRYKECNEIALPYSTARSRIDKERKKAMARERVERERAEEELRGSLWEDLETTCEEKGHGERSLGRDETFGDVTSGDDRSVSRTDHKEDLKVWSPEHHMVKKGTSEETELVKDAKEQQSAQEAEQESEQETEQKMEQGTEQGMEQDNGTGPKRTDFL